MARRSTAEIFGVNVEEGSTRCEPEEDLEYTISSVISTQLNKKLG